ncbi:MAG: D-alanyl-D-alanine carboxypeptidase family protein [Oscillospiraceae bacterium]|nr:D-alanyl-D-alanine carboxypeptidase family protein [Oscillospiraceae bacterium]
MRRRQRKSNRLITALVALAILFIGGYAFALAGNDSEEPMLWEQTPTMTTPSATPAPPAEPLCLSAKDEPPSGAQTDKPPQTEDPPTDYTPANEPDTPDHYNIQTSTTERPIPDTAPDEINTPTHTPTPIPTNTPTTQTAVPTSQGLTLCAIDTATAATVIQPSDISWYKQLFNQHNRVDSGFSPPALRTLTGSHVSVDERIYTPLNQLMQSARNAGATIWAQSGYRPYTTQRNLFANRVNTYTARGYSREQAEQNTAHWIAAPGTSEHQSGLAVDFNCITMAFEQTLAFQWLLENAHRYGFILRYPPGTTHITGVSYEPWHFRYVGIEHATRIWEYSVTLEEYIKWYFWR